LARPADVDANTQPGYAGTPLIVVDGTGTGIGTGNGGGPVFGDGFTIVTGLARLQGIEIDGFQGNGILVDTSLRPSPIGPSALSLPGSVVLKNLVMGPGQTGVQVVGASNVVGANTVVSPGANGIGVSGLGGSNTLAGNTVVNTQGAGILVVNGPSSLVK